MCGEHDDGQCGRLFGQKSLKLQTVHTGHADIEDQTARLRRVVLIEEGLGIFKRFRLVTDGLQKQRQGIANRRVIVDHKDERFGIHDSDFRSSGMRPFGKHSSGGKVNVKLRPRCGFDSAFNCPACDSMIDRQIARPMPRPVAFVE